MLRIKNDVLYIGKNNSDSLIPYGEVRFYSEDEETRLKFCHLLNRFKNRYRAMYFPTIVDDRGLTYACLINIRRDLILKAIDIFNEGNPINHAVFMDVDTLKKAHDRKAVN